MRKVMPEKMFDYSKLRGRIRELGFPEYKVAENIGMTSTGFSLIISKQRPMYSNIIFRLAILLDIKPEEFYKYFFSPVTGSDYK